ncbi:MAG TPA: AAA family ATPase [Thermoleophilia bacterium]|nr:AAA family ATPase [Thermoleophilia bacterium]
MTFLSRIRMKGFKTFARPTELVFEQGVSVIIGPNGSGKSNVADAVLWALGEQSPTTIRARSMQDVIFSGSDGQRPAAVAEVSLVFDNAKGVFPLDFAEVEISRRVTRDGTSKYRINGAASRLVDVEDLVGGVGLGRYKKRRDRALAKLEKVRTNLLRVSDVEREVRAALRPLKQQVSAAERYAEASEEVARLRAQGALLALVGLEGRIETERSTFDEVSARRAETEASLAALRDERTREEERFTTALREREALSAVYHQAAADVDRVRSRGASLDQRVARMEAELARARRRAAIAAEEDGVARARVDALGDGPAQAAGRLNLVVSAAESLAARLEEMRPSLEAVARDEDVLRDEVFGLEAERARALQEKDFLVREMAGRTRRAEELAEAVRVAARRLDEVRNTSRERAGMVAAAEVTLAGLEEEVSVARRGAAALQMEADQARVLARSLAERLSAATSRVTVLEEVASRREGTPPAARALLESESGAVLVVEALRVRAGYERAVAAALGPLASAVVVSGGTDAELLRSGEGLVEILWPAGEPRSDPDGGKAQAPAAPAAPDARTGGVDIWDVIDGPEGVVRALKAILPPTRLVARDDVPSSSFGDRAVTAEGELWHGRLHGARRGEAVAEALLAVRAELEVVRAAQTALQVESDAALLEADRCMKGSAAGEQAAAAVAERVREARAGRDSLADEVTLWSRRSDEAEAEAVEADERRARDADLARELQEGLASVEARLHQIGTGLDVSRAALRAAKEKREAIRDDVAVLEGKRSQASLLTVRLRERERAREEERTRARDHARLAARSLTLARQRESALESYLPALRSLAQVATPLVRALEGELSSLETSLARSRATTDDFGDALKDQGRRESDLQRGASDLNEELVRVQVAMAHLEEQAAERRRELDELRRKHLSPRDVDAASVAGLHADEVLVALDRAERKRERIGPVNPLAEQEFREMEERAGFLFDQRRDLEASLTELRAVIRDLDQHIETTFTEVFEATRKHFEEMVQILFPGGKGVLRLAEAEPGQDSPDGEDDPGLEGETASAPGPGIVLEIKPPRKTPRSMNLLSGGEKALAAIAFLFALFLARPCPFYVLDEVEAALDDLNLGRFLSLVRRYQQRTQFIVITHQRRSMEIADRLYGVAMDTDGTSRVLSRRLGAEGPVAERA